MLSVAAFLNLDTTVYAAIALRTDAVLKARRVRLIGNVGHCRAILAKEARVLDTLSTFSVILAFQGAVGNARAVGDETVMELTLRSMKTARAFTPVVRSCVATRSSVVT